MQSTRSSAPADPTPTVTGAPVADPAESATADAPEPPPSPLTIKLRSAVPPADRRA